MHLIVILHVVHIIVTCPVTPSKKMGLVFVSYKYYIFLVSQKVLICTVLTRILGQDTD